MNAAVLHVSKAKLLWEVAFPTGLMAVQSVLQAWEPMPSATPAMFVHRGWHHSTSWHVPLHTWLLAVLHSLHWWDKGMRVVNKN